MITRRKVLVQIGSSQSTKQELHGLHRTNSPLVWYARTIPVRTGLFAALSQCRWGMPKMGRLISDDSRR